MVETNILPPEQCTSMTQVRVGVDAVDAALIAMMQQRYGYMQAAARIKQSRNEVRDEARKAQVIGNAASMAKEAGLPQDDIAAFWELLVESSIAYEMKHWDAARVNTK